MRFRVRDAAGRWIKSEGQEGSGEREESPRDYAWAQDGLEQDCYGRCSVILFSYFVVYVSEYLPDYVLPDFLFKMAGLSKTRF